jgi:ribosomal protein S18 acetylase RimI-like enzyme
MRDLTTVISFSPYAGGLLMILLRSFIESDNATLLEIEKLCPQGNDKIAESMDKSPDAIARYRLYDNWEVSVAEEDNRVAGWIGWTLKQDSAEKKYGYLAEVIVHPDFQRRGIATELMRKAEIDLVENGASHAYGYVFEANDASNAMFTKNGYAKVGEIQMQAISVYKKAKVAPEVSIRRAGRDDIPHIVDLINSYNEGRVHFVPYTTERFENHVNNIPGYSMDNLWVALANDRIAACTGLWDISAIAKMYYAKEPASMRIIGAVFDFLDKFTSMPKIPGEKEFFIAHYLTDYAFMPENPESSVAMANLIRYLNNVLLDTQSISIVALVTPDDPIFQVTRESKPLVEKWNIYAKSLECGSMNLQPLYLDVRDFIM